MESSFGSCNWIHGFTQNYINDLSKLAGMSIKYCIPTMIISLALAAKKSAKSASSFIILAKPQEISIEAQHVTRRTDTSMGCMGRIAASYRAPFQSFAIGSYKLVIYTVDFLLDFHNFPCPVSIKVLRTAML